MNSFGGIVWGLLFCVLVGIFGLVVYNNLVDSQAALAEAEGKAKAGIIEAKGEAQALVLNAQGQARLDSAQAFAVTSGAFTSAAMPWLVVSIVGAMFILALVYLRSQPQPQATQAQYPPMIIERQVLLLHPGQAEAMMLEWQRDRQRIDG